MDNNYIHTSVIMEELDRLVRTKQIDMIHTDLERIEQDLIKENKSFPHERVVKPTLAEIKKETAEEYGKDLYDILSGYMGFHDWIKENNEYGANGERLKQFFIKQIRIAIADYQSKCSL